MISIIVPVYNAEHYLRQCVGSALAQTYRDIELILVDDGSRDASGTICDEYQKADRRVRVIHQQNAGEGAARNAGLGICRGEWATFLDSDDYLDEDYVETLAVGATGCSIVVSGWRRVGEGKSEEVRLHPGHTDFSSPAELIKKYRFDTFGYVAGKLYRTDIIREHSLSFSRVKLKADLLFFFEYLSCIHDVCIIDYCGYNYRQIVSSMSHMPFPFNTYLSLMIDFYRALTVTTIDHETKRLLVANCLDGPIGLLYNGEYSRKERIEYLKSIDKRVYRETEITTSWKSKVLCWILCHGLYSIYDINMIRNKKKNRN